MRLVEIDYDTYVELGKAGVWVNWNPRNPSTSGWLTSDEMLQSDGYRFTKRSDSLRYFTRMEDGDG